MRPHERRPPLDRNLCENLIKKQVAIAVNPIGFVTIGIVRGHVPHINVHIHRTNKLPHGIMKCSTATDLDARIPGIGVGIESMLWSSTSTLTRVV